MQRPAKEIIMLLRGLTLLVMLQLIGTAINVLFLPMLPGQVIGMLLLFALLIVRGGVGPALSEAAGTLLKYLPLLLIPTAVGVVLFLQAVEGQLLAVGAALLLSLIVSMVFTGWLMQKLIIRHVGHEDEQ
jgi:holin-like protein